MYVPSHLCPYWSRTNIRCCTAALFIDVPHSSISWIYASIGCQHTLQPTSDVFKPPSIPTLTTHGFVRWQSIEILLGPEEHVPFIQYAIQNFPIKNPETGAPFPQPLPKEAFPLTTDVEIEQWHSNCAIRLKQQATPDLSDDIGSRPHLPPRPNVEHSFSHVRGVPTNGAAARSKTDYFGRNSRPPVRPIPFQHVSGTGRPVRPPLSHHRTRQFLAPEMAGPGSPESPRLARSRRRSYPENMNGSPVSPNGEPPSPEMPSAQPRDNVRPHSHPPRRRRGSVSSDASSEDEYSNAEIPRRKSHPHKRDGSNPDIRFEYPSPVSSPQHPPGPIPGVRPRHRVGRERPEEAKRQSQPIPLDVNGKLSEPFTMGQRAGTRNSSRGSNNVRWKDLSDMPNIWRKAGSKGSKSSEEDREPGRRGDLPDSARHSRDFDRETERDRDSGSGSGHHKRRERDRVREQDKDPSSPRPRMARHSSHEADIPRERDRDSPRERDWERDRDRERDGRSFRERADGRGRGGMSPPPMRGVDGRRYPVR